MNSHDAKYYRRCSMILEPEEALRVEDQRHNLEKKVEDLLKRLEVLEGRNLLDEGWKYLASLDIERFLICLDERWHS